MGEGAGHLGFRQPPDGPLAAPDNRLLAPNLGVPRDPDTQ